MTTAGVAGAEILVEVAVSLPVPGTFTYRDPRGVEAPAVGTQVVVPFGRRTVPGFVVGRAERRPGRGRVLDLEAVLGAEPALSEDLVALCRWAADYYLAPLGEALRAALPEGEKARSVRTVRLTAAGERAAAAMPLSLPGTGSGPAGDAAVLAALSEAGGELPARSVARLAPGAARSLGRLTARGLVEAGDALHDRSAGRTITLAFIEQGGGSLPLAPPRTPPRSGGQSPPSLARSTRAAESASRATILEGAGGAAVERLPPRAAARRAVLALVAAAGSAGLDAATLDPSQRAHLRALAAAGLARVERRPRPPGTMTTPSGPPPPELNPGQRAAFEALASALPAGFATFVLHGVTGSGKTEVYLRLIAEARRAGRGALVLVPEIALTPQLAARFRARFGDDVAVLHSGLPSGARLAAWRRLRSGEVGIAVGARSALFAPVLQLGVVVVDEEHDASFKQDEGFRYSARDLAVVRARREGAVAVLGSATPSLETIHNAALGRFRLLRLPVRATARPLPAVDIVDLRRHPPGADGLLASPLADALAAVLAAGEQAILFLNRRGFSTVVLCRACGHVVRCPNCAVSMTYHRGRDRLVCHYCARIEPVPQRCPACGQARLQRLGMGTEQAEAVVRARFPGARVARLDRDTAGGGAGGSAAMERILGDVARGAVDILVGTQMVTKGHDFPGVTLVGVLAPDQGLHLPDFRAAERTFQLLAQVAGRAGRGERPGRVIVQTYCPEHPAVACVRDHDYDAFARDELARRREAGYPPFARMAALRIDGSSEARVKQAAAAAALAAGAAGRGRVRVLGPAEAPIARVRGRIRWQVWLSSSEPGLLRAAAGAGAAVTLPADTRLVVDIDPQSVL